MNGRSVGRRSRVAGDVTSSVELPIALEEHRRALTRCRRCRLPAGCARPVVSESLVPRGMLIGQAPGRVEVDDGRPFAGRAGRTLFRWLERAGLDERAARHHLHFAAVTRCYPGPSPSGRGDRVPSPAEQVNCRPWLDAELRLLRPPLVVLVGRLAIVSMLGSQPLRDVVGEAHVISHAGGQSLAIPLPHPSGASSWIHQPGHAQLLEAALARLAGELRRLGIVDGTEAGVGVRVA